MARQKRQSKLEPAVMTIGLQLPPAPAGGVTEVTADLSQICSIVNRRFYRQGLNWAVAGFTLADNTAAGGVVAIHKLPSTWVLGCAWEKAFHSWKDQQDTAVDESGAQSAVAKFRDFKVHMDIEHVTDTFAQNLLPSDGAGNVATPGEWQPTQIVIPNLIADASGSEVDPHEYFLHMVGLNVNGAATSRGVLDGYANSRAYPQSPDPVSPSISTNENWMKQMIDVGNDASEILDNAVDRNDELPYPQVDYPGADTQLPGLEVVNVTNFTSTTISAINHLPGSTFPCGLIRFVTRVEGTIDVLVHMVPGNHRGYAVQKMEDF